MDRRDERTPTTTTPAPETHRQRSRVIADPDAGPMTTFVLPRPDSGATLEAGRIRDWLAARDITCDGVTVTADGETIVSVTGEMDQKDRDALTARLRDEYKEYQHELSDREQREAALRDGARAELGRIASQDPDALTPTERLLLAIALELPRLREGLE